MVATAPVPLARAGYRLNNTPTRWQRALKRALDNGLSAYQEAGTGLTLVTSGSNPGVCYATDGAACSCESAMLGNDPVCQHRALYWHRAGVLDLDPTPAPPAAPVALPVRCRTSVGDVIAGGRVLYRSNDPQPIRPAA